MDYDFSKIPEFKDSPESFDIIADKVSGRIPVTRLEHWRDFPDLLGSNFFNQDGVETIFRGHRRYDWALMPTLARVSDNEMISKQLADEQLRRFKQAIRGRINDHSLVEDGIDQENELWAVGQHHGLMTPLLDWTYSPYVALFFAFSKEDVEVEKNNEYRSIYILNKTFIESDKLCADIPVIEPKKDDHGRLVNQAGLFTFSPYESTIEIELLEAIINDKNLNAELMNSEPISDSEGNSIGDGQAAILAKYICKVYIKNADRKGCIKHLRQMNVHHASLFPDLIGASEFCNELISEHYQKTEGTEVEFDKAMEDAAKKELISETEFMNDSINFSEEIPKVAEQSFEYKVTKNEGQQDEIRSDDDQIITNRIQDEAFIEYFIALKSPEILKATRKRMVLLINEILVDTLTVDWEKRESIKAKARSSIRSILRKYGFPMKYRDEFLQKLFY